MAEFIKGLGLDLFDFRGKFVCITEENTADANFCLGPLMWQALGKQSGGVCLLALHHSIMHYYHMGMRLGYNLPSILGKRFEAVDALDILDSAKDHTDKKAYLAKQAFFLLKTKLESVRKNSKNVFVLIDDLSNFMNIGLSVKEVITFIQYLRISMHADETLVIGSHCNEKNKDQEFVKNFITLTCDLKIDITSLETGLSKEVSGSLGLTKKDTDAVSGWTPLAYYHYRTGERTIKVFSPGNINFTYSL